MRDVNLLSVPLPSAVALSVTASSRRSNVIERT